MTNFRNFVDFKSNNLESSDIGNLGVFSIITFFEEGGGGEIRFGR